MSQDGAELQAVRAQLASLTAEVAQLRSSVRALQDTVSRTGIAAEYRRYRELREWAEASHAEQHRTTKKPDAVNAAILAVLAEHVPLGVTFYAASVIARLDADARLRQALEAHRLDSVERLGAWLRDVCHQRVGPLRVSRCKRDRGGVLWSIDPVM